MDSIRQTGFQAASRDFVAPSAWRGQGLYAGSEDDEKSEDEERPRDGFFECLVPEEELDEEEEQAEGARHEAELLEKYPLWEDEPSTLLLEELHDILLPHMSREELVYEFLGLDTDLPFASSCPNGAIYFTKGLLEALDDEDVLFFAAHELAHTELRHYATRKRRLSDLRQLIPHPIGSPSRQRMDLAAVLAVRHQEEFEADLQASQWVGDSGVRALRKLHNLCRETSPESLQRPTHPKFEIRVSCLVERKPFGPPLEYLYSLIG